MEQTKTLKVNGEEFKVTFTKTNTDINIVEVYDTLGFKQDLNNLENHNGIVSKMIVQIENDLMCEK